MERDERYLDALARRFGETVQYAVLDGRCVVYRAKVDPPSGAVRLTSTVGGRNPTHCTAVGKLLLAHHVDSPQALATWIGDAAHPAGAVHGRGAADLAALVESVEEIRRELGTLGQGR